MSILTERIPKPTCLHRRIDALRTALAELEYLLPVAERVHGTAAKSEHNPPRTEKPRRTRKGVKHG